MIENTPPAVPEGTSDVRAILEHIAETACESGDAVWASEAREIAEAMLSDPRIEVRPRGPVTDAEDADALIAETRAFLAERPMGPPIYHRIGKLVAALEAARGVQP